jgi:elongator complex protein 3
VNYTKIKEWYENGTYKPYFEDDLKRVIKYALSNVPPYIRVNRVIRDILIQDVIAGVEKAELRDIIMKEMEKEQIECHDIRTREVKYKNFDRNDIELVVRKYFASNGIEYFLSHESKDRKTLYSLLRLRVNSIKNKCVFPKLQNSTMIRELHVYGQMVQHNTEAPNNATQHQGLGQELIQKAIEITKEIGYNEISVISGIGVYQYYSEKFGFEKTDYGYMIKKI